MLSLAGVEAAAVVQREWGARLRCAEREAEKVARVRAAGAAFAAAMEARARRLVAPRRLVAARRPGVARAAHLSARAAASALTFGAAPLPDDSLNDEEAAAQRASFLRKAAQSEAAAHAYSLCAGEDYGAPLTPGARAAAEALTAALLAPDVAASDLLPPTVDRVAARVCEALSAMGRSDANALQEFLAAAREVLTGALNRAIAENAADGSTGVAPGLLFVDLVQGLQPYFLAQSLAWRAAYAEGVSLLATLLAAAAEALLAERLAEDRPASPASLAALPVPGLAAPPSVELAAPPSAELAAPPAATARNSQLARDVRSMLDDETDPCALLQARHVCLLVAKAAACAARALRPGALPLE